MIERDVLLPPENIYPVDDWRMVERTYDERFLAESETLFSTANGYLGMRGNFEEGGPVFQNGTFVNKFHETWPIVYGEDAFGFAKTGQTMLNVTDSKLVKLFVDDEALFLPQAILHDYERALNMKEGTLDRRLLWETPSGKKVSVNMRRFVSFEHKHLAAVCYEVCLPENAAEVVISSEARYSHKSHEDSEDPRKGRSFQGRVMLPQLNFCDNLRAVLVHQTKNSHYFLCCGIDHALDTDCPYTVKSCCDEDSAEVMFRIKAESGKTIRLWKFMTYHDSQTESAASLREYAENSLDKAIELGFEQLLKEQKAFMEDFWTKSDVEFEAGYPRAQQYVRWNLFQLLQASAKAEGRGIGARGLTGAAYEGHYFWDTEIYVLPSLIYTNPEAARNILMYRYRKLKNARARAREVNQVGALFPWRTINGNEASAYYAAGTAQYHINADIMYAVKKYVDISGDEEFLLEYGAEMLVETARLWVDLGFFTKEEHAQFCIHGVTGPDEYNAIVNNNTFTNLMARENLRYAVETTLKLQEKHPLQFAKLTNKTKLDPEEIKEWRKAAECMYIPYDEALGINPQDDSFLEKESWDFANTPREKYPLLLHHHPLVIYRHKVIKQADVVLAMFLLNHEFSAEQKKKNFDYYDPLTTGDSSLSACIQSIIAFELNEIDQALSYLRYAFLMDLGNVAGNVTDGAHIACIGGTWMGCVYGMAGLRDYNGEISFKPKLPADLNKISFTLQIRNQHLHVCIENKATYTTDAGEKRRFANVENNEVTYSLTKGAGLSFKHFDEDITLQAGQKVSKMV